MYRSKRGGVYKSKRYLQWIEEAALMIKTTRKGAKIYPPYKFIMTISGGKGWRSNRDLDNCLKPVLDLLTTMNIIEDDNCHLVNSLSVIFVAGNGSDAKCMVELLENH
jgi:Holliday junction resolvase RusA-like endonuclease